MSNSTMPALPQATTQRDRWIDCFRSGGTRPMPVWLRERLDVERRRARRRMLWPWLLPVLGLIVPLGSVMLLAVLAPKQQALGTAMLIALIIAPLVGGGIALLLSKDGASMWRRARRDLKYGMVEGFELDPAVEIELNAARSLGRDAPDLPRRLDVLPASSRLAARDGVPVPKFESVHIAHLARAPIDAVLEPVERRGTASPGRPGDLESCATAQRAMTAAERVELVKLRRRLMAAWVWLPLPLAFITLGALSLYHGRMGIDHGIMWSFWLLVGAVSVRGVYRSARSRIIIGRDLRDGRILVLDTEALRNHLRAHNQQPPAVLPEIAEHLASSGMVWTSDGVPAPWRMQVQQKE